MAQVIDWPGYTGPNLPKSGNSNSSEYTAELLGEKVKKYSDLGRVYNALYNPKTGDTHVTTDNVDKITPEMWANWPRVSNNNRYLELKALSASGKISQDKMDYGAIYPEFQDQANQFYEQYKVRGAAVITSTEFPQISVNTISQALVNRQSLVAQKYNLLNFPQQITVSDTINIVFPEYNNTTQSVRVGYKENEPIDTMGYGTFSQTNVTLKKAGGGLAFTEEYYMKQFTMDIQSLLLDKMALDFTTARYTRILAKLAAMTGLAGSSWSAYTAPNPQSTNRPTVDINAARKAIYAADKLAVPDIIIANELTWMNFYTNTWVRGSFGSDLSAASQNFNQIVANPAGLPWAAKGFVINEDVPDNQAYILDSRLVVDVEGPRKTQQINTYNPDQTIFIQKQWFDIVTPSTRSGWGRRLTGI